VSSQPQRADLYDRLGGTYRQTRQEDPRIAARIGAALGAAGTIVNVGAGAGSYEQPGRQLIAVEPSEVMIRQRAADAAPAVRAVAEALPFADRSFDAAMAILTVHHWADPRRGLAELRRVAAVVVIFVASTLTSSLWLTAEYFPQMARARRPEIQPEQIAAQLGDDVRIEPLLLPRDCQDGFGEAFWGRPEAYLDPGVRAGMSAFGLLRRAEIEPGLRRLSADLESGAWDARHGHLREADELDTGHRLIVAAPGARGPAAVVSPPAP
jgi:SAM-dependent methyltransferase